MARSNADFKVADKNGRNMMEILGIPVERCEELCSLIEQTHAENPDKPMGEVIEIAGKHCKSDEERDFMFYIFGKHLGTSVALDMLRNPGALFEMLHHS